MVARMTLNHLVEVRIFPGEQLTCRESHGSRYRYSGRSSGQFWSFCTSLESVELKNQHAKLKHVMISVSLL
jgi:hypothetical protein